MKCPICESENIRVTNVRTREGKIYRRRKCLDCGEKFTTYEVDTAMLMELFEEHFNLETNSKIASILDHNFPTRSRVGG